MHKITHGEHQNNNKRTLIHSQQLKREGEREALTAHIRPKMNELKQQQQQNELPAENTNKTITTLRWYWCAALDALPLNAGLASCSHNLILRAYNRKLHVTCSTSTRKKKKKKKTINTRNTNSYSEH